MRETRPLVKCPQCGEIVRARHATFRHCGRQYPVEPFKLQNDNPHESVGNPVESDSVKEAIAERIEKGEFSGEVDVTVKGIPVHIEFESRGNPESNPDSDLHLKPSNPEHNVLEEGKDKVFNKKKGKADYKTESKIEKTVEKTEPDKEESLRNVGSDKLEKEDETLKCPTCDGELIKVKKVEDNGFLKLRISEDSDVYVCRECKKLYGVKRLVEKEKNIDCPYCEEELHKVRGNEGLYRCLNCHRFFTED